MQRAGRGHLQPVVVNRKPDGAAAHGIVPVAQRVRQRLPRGQGRVERLVDARHAARLEAAGDGKRVAQKALGACKEGEGVAVELPVVEKLRAVEAPETRDAEQALRHFAFEAPGVPEQHRGGPERDAVAEQPQSAKQIPRLPATGMVQPADPDGLRNRVSDLGEVQVVRRPSVRRLGLPASIVPASVACAAPAGKSRGPPQTAAAQPVRAPVAPFPEKNVASWRAIGQCIAGNASLGETPWRVPPSRTLRGVPRRGAGRVPPVLPSCRQWRRA